jgi:hypothetical protein
MEAFGALEILIYKWVLGSLFSLLLVRKLFYPR